MRGQMLSMPERADNGRIRQHALAKIDRFQSKARRRLDKPQVMRADEGERFLGGPRATELFQHLPLNQVGSR